MGFLHKTCFILICAFVFLSVLYVRSTAKVIYGREKLRKKEKPGSRAEESLDDSFDESLDTDREKRFAIDEEIEDESLDDVDESLDDSSDREKRGVPACYPACTQYENCVGGRCVCKSTCYRKKGLCVPRGGGSYRRSGGYRRGGGYRRDNRYRRGGGYRRDNRYRRGSGYRRDNRYRRGGGYRRGGY